MAVTVRYFASLREALGERETLELAAPATVGQVRATLRAKSAAHAEALAARRAVRASIDHTMAGDADLVRDGAEVGFFPPVTGG